MFFFFFVFFVFFFFFVLFFCFVFGFFIFFFVVVVVFTLNHTEMLPNFFFCVKCQVKNDFTKDVKRRVTKISLMSCLMSLALEFLMDNYVLLVGL